MYFKPMFMVIFMVRYRDLSESLLLRLFGKSPKIKMLDLFFDNPYFDFTKKLEELINEVSLRIAEEELEQNNIDIVLFQRAKNMVN